jgi:LacI family transcriptional regulator
VRKLAEQTGYRPKPLRAKLARSIGMLFGTATQVQPDADFQGRLAWQAQRLLAGRGLHVNLECIDRTSRGKLPAVVQQNRVDGVLLAGHPPAELIAQIRELGLPAVAINDTVERVQISCVRSNPEPAIHQVIVHLAARGHTEFGLLITNMQYPTLQARHRSYDSTLRELGIEPQPSWLCTDLPQEITGGREGIRQLQQRGPLPTAILCENDWMALGAMMELSQQGLRVPQDISLAGHDDVWICNQVEPQLTSIARSEDQLVGAAIDLLMEQIQHGVGSPREVLVEGQMIWRASTGPAPRRLKEHAGDSGAG